MRSRWSCPTCPPVFQKGNCPTGRKPLPSPPSSFAQSTLVPNGLGTNFGDGGNEPEGGGHAHCEGPFEGQFVGFSLGGRGTFASPQACLVWLANAGPRPRHCFLAGAGAGAAKSSPAVAASPRGGEGVCEVRRIRLPLRYRPCPSQVGGHVPAPTTLEGE